MDKIEDVMRLALCPGVGPRAYRRLIEAFGSPAEALAANYANLVEVEGLGDKLAAEIVKASDFDPRPELNLAAERGVRIICQSDPEYPAPLKSTFDPPILLYVRGQLLRQDGLAIGVVGTRAPTQYGQAQAERFSSLLARTGFTVVSGLARGVDSYAHRGALVAGGRTIAVLGSGLGHIYPEENRDLAAEISTAGAVVSEYPMDMQPAKENFPRRNRIIAGLSLGVLVVEAPVRSGALITARVAIDLNREVFAIPGRIDQRSAEGCNTLIAKGQARLVQGLEDILEELGPVSDALKAAIQPAEVKAGGEGKDSPAAAKTAEQVKGQRGSQGEAPQMSLFAAQGKAGQAVSGQPAGAFQAEQPARAAYNAKEARILAVLSSDPLHIDEICAKTGLAVQEVSATLMMLEIKRAVTQQPGKFYLRKG